MIIFKPDELTWRNILAEELGKPYYSRLISFIQQQRTSGQTIFPEEHHMFRAFELTPLKSLKVVILGQDPYSNEGQANGLCFSVKHGQPIPPSLKNIFVELKDDVGTACFQDGDLSNWANQGVLLLNTILTVAKGKPLSHAHQGWEQFTDCVISCISKFKENVVFILWGTAAKKKELLIDKGKHKILIASHPSPLSAYRGFFGCRHFSKTNDYLVKHSLSAISW